MLRSCPFIMGVTDNSYSTLYSGTVTIPVEYESLDLDNSILSLPHASTDKITYIYDLPDTILKS